MLADDRQEGLAIGFQLARSDPDQLAQFGQVPGPQRGHVAQGAVVENDVRRNARFGSKIAA